jgi:high-affinity iron transporter
MLPTFVIGLREGLEAALIVGIIAAFLRKQGRRDLVRWVFVGVAVAVVLCLGVGIALDVLSRDLPQRQQEGLETVVGVLAVGMVTYMVIWMRRHARELKDQLEGLAADAIGSSAGKGGRAMVLMAFLAVLREGFETVVFLLAAFNENGSGAAAGFGAVLGIVIAMGLGYGIYRGGVRINLSKFFRATGLVLVLVAAGLVVNALHTAHEAGWLNSGQGGTVDLAWLVRPGSVQASLLTGMLGVQPNPVVIEVIGWLAYLVPLGCYVAWPPGRVIPRRAVMRSLTAVGALAAVGAVLLGALGPARPAAGALSAGALSATVVSNSGEHVVIRAQPQSPAGGAPGASTELTLRRARSALHVGIAADDYTVSVPGTTAASLATSLSVDRVAALNGGRLPIGLQTGAGATLPVRYTDQSTLTLWLEPRTGRIIDLAWTETVRAAVVGSVGSIALSGPAAAGTDALPATVARAAVSAARHGVDTLDRRSAMRAGAWACGVLALVALLAAGGLLLGIRPRPDTVSGTVEPVSTLVRS